MRLLVTHLGTAVGAVLAALLAVLALLAAGETAAWALFEVSWAEGSEIEGVLLIWFALLGAAYGVHTRVHLGVEILTRRLPAGARAVLGRLAAALVALFGVLLAVYGAKLAATVSNTLPATGLSASVQYFPAVVCGALTAVFAGAELVWAAPEPPPADSAADD